MEKSICEFVTGSFRGYTHVADRGVETDFIRIPENLKGIRGNKRKALEKFKKAGCTHYTVAPFPYYNSTNYSFLEYYGYKLAEV